MKKPGFILFVIVCLKKIHCSILIGCYGLFNTMQCYIKTFHIIVGRSLENTSALFLENSDYQFFLETSAKQSLAKPTQLELIGISILNHSTNRQSCLCFVLDIASRNIIHETYHFQPEKVKQYICPLLSTINAQIYRGKELVVQNKSYVDVFICSDIHHHVNKWYMWYQLYTK